MFEELPACRPQLQRRAHVLVVDDDRINRLVASQFCITFGASVESVSSGPEAVELCSSGVYDLVLMDIRMPGMDGIEAAEAIRRLPGEAAQVPILVVTADVDATTKSRCAAAGLGPLVQKPLSGLSLFRAIEEALGAPLHPQAQRDVG